MSFPEIEKDGYKVLFVKYIVKQIDNGTYYYCPALMGKIILIDYQFPY